MTRLALSLLGPVEISRDGGAITGLTAKTQALLTYLVIEFDRSHRRDALAGLLWGELSDAAARNNLRQSLHQLQNALDENSPPFLLITPQTVQFNPASDYYLDVAEFTQLLDDCDHHSHRRLETCRACNTRLQRAANLYRGALLANFSLKDSNAFEEWALVKREFLARRALAAFGALADYHARRGEYAPMEHHARRQIEIDPFYEPAHRRVMRACAWSERRNAALTQYESLRQMLANELRAVPEQATTALYEQITAEEVSPPELAPLYNFPALLTPFIGRAQDLARVEDSLGNPETRLLTLGGPGGVGKTRLALQVATQAALTFRAGACYVSLAAIASSELVVPTIAGALRLTPSGTTDAKTQLSDYLRDKEILLVLDSFEHVIAGAPLVAELLAACPRLTILITSREWLNLRSERRVLVEPLPLPTAAHLQLTGAALVSAVAGYASVMLFADRARALQPQFALTPENGLTIAEICVRLEGLPLAIELAAARQATYSPQMTLAQLTDRFALLTGGPRDLPARQQTLRATLDWSYALLSADEQRLFARLAVFSGGCTPETVERIASDSLVSPAVWLESLHDKNLVRRQDGDGQEPRFGMLDTIYEYACERLAESGELETMRRRHAQHWVSLVDQLDVDVGESAAVLGLLDQAEIEHNNFRAALRWAINNREAEIALRLTGGLWRFWWWRNYLNEGCQWLADALAIPASNPTSPTLARARANALMGAGALSRARNEMPQAVASLTESVTLWRQLGDAAGLAFALFHLGVVALHQENFEFAMVCLEESLMLYRQLGEAGKRGVGRVLNELGQLAQWQGQADAAYTYFEESLAILREVGSVVNIPVTLQNLGYVVLARGDFDRAAELMHESLGLFQMLNMAQGTASVLTGLAAVADAQQQTTRAVRLFGAAHALFDALHASLDPGYRSVYERYLAQARAQMEPGAFETAWAEGRALNVEQAITLALADD